MRRRRYHYVPIFLSLLVVVFVTFLVSVGIKGIGESKKAMLMVDLSKYTAEQIKKYAKDNDLSLDLKEEYNLDIVKGALVSQSIKLNTKINKNDKLAVVISKGSIPNSVYINDKINELGQIPVMMYHGIVDVPSKDTGFTGGNVDKDGYTRTKEAFEADLEMYYQKGYRMIRLKDYVDGNIAIPYGKSPIILTFDDGNKNNFNVLGKDKNGNLEIDPKSAVGILEKFKTKYPDFNVTATFFLNKGLFEQPTYNADIMKWLVNHGYDIGNHTKSHADFTKINSTETEAEIAYMYQTFDTIIPNQYLHIIALPYGSPYNKTHANFPLILNGTSNGYTYKTIATLRVGWMPDYSPFSKNFDATFIKRIRAYDNDGKEFDIAMCFKNLESTRYISDGNPNTVVVPDDTNLNPSINKKIITY